MPRPLRVVPPRFPWLVVLVLLLGRTTPGLAQAAPDDEPYLPGLVGILRDAKGRTWSLVDPQLALDWAEARPDPRLAAGEFRAAWQGHVYVQARGAYRFTLFGTGEVELKVAGQTAVTKQV